MDYLSYKVLHILGLLLVFTAVGGMTLHTLNGGDRDSNRARKLVGISHGVGLVILLVSGFGMIAKLQLGFPAWIWVKVAIWLFFGAVTVVIRRLAGTAAALWFILPLIGTVAAYLAIFKPGA